jgi:DNA primase
VYNVDAQQEDQKYIFVTEGPFDALAIDGVALLTNNIAEQQYRIIQGLGHEVIVIPDQDEAGTNLITKATEYGWSVAFPTWDDDVKDVADAVSKYGKMFTMIDIIKSAQAGSIKINMAKQKFKNKLEKVNEENN